MIYTHTALGKIGGRDWNHQGIFLNPEVERVVQLTWMDFISLEVIKESEDNTSMTCSTSIWIKSTGKL